MKKVLTISTLALAMSTAANADVRINGFANLIGGITSSDDTLYGYDDNIGFGEESLFAIQVSGDINDRMTATGQLVARGSDDYEVDFEWAYLTYQVTDKVSISAGRLRLPLFRYSASLDVGYSYHWVNAPRAVYDVPFNNLDGVRVDYNTFVGDWEINLQAGAGTYENEIAGGKLEGSNTLVFSAEATYEWFKVRGVYGRSNATLEIPDLAPAFAQMQQVSPELAGFLSLNDDSGTFLGLGVEVDQFDWFVSAEITSIETEESFSPKDVAYYVTAGARINKWTPTLTYESLDGNNDIKGLDIVAGLPAQLQPAGAALAAGVQLPFMEEYDVITAGVRYDYDTNVAFKADVSKYTDDIDESNDATLVRVAVNYVF
ncbi:porin [Alteromonas oceanisediminis]|uniref:porin n=1 Tax=Alteromonas oceanisediminis TaxID=2836180 RepID=UPI001BD9C1B6|nr:porin [Alteromonas oceanisediminis]MBT0587352.1 topoisomerase IV [Alteromonas oceanisediminis]